MKTVIEIIKKISISYSGFLKKCWSRGVLYKIGTVFLVVLLWPVTLLALCWNIFHKFDKPLMGWLAVLGIILITFPLSLSWIEGLTTRSSNKTPPAKTSLGTDCVGPNGKHISLSKADCEKFNNAWKNPPQQSVQTTLTPTEIPLSTSPTSTSKPMQTEIPTPTRKIVKGSTPKGIEFYEKVDSLHKQGKINGELCTEYESDPIVDVNPKMQSVQLSLMYPSIVGNVDNSDKDSILNDFRVIKALAEQDPSLILSEYGTLRLFVLTFHNSSCIGKGELQQLMIDSDPEWTDWK